jgi:hypothetical protein
LRFAYTVIVWTKGLFLPWDAATYRGAAACTGAGSYSSGSSIGALNDREKTELLGEEPPLRQSVDQTQCSGRHVRNIAEENVWVKAEKVTVGRTEHNAGCMTAYLSVSSIVFSQVVVNVKEFLDVGNRLNAVLMSVIDERFLSDFDSLQKSK